MGAVGNDENALEMERAAREDGLNLVYEICESYETGTCTVLITGKERLHDLIYSSFLNDEYFVMLLKKIQITSHQSRSC